MMERKSGKVYEFPEFSKRNLETPEEFGAFVSALTRCAFEEAFVGLDYKFFLVFTAHIANSQGGFLIRLDLVDGVTWLKYSIREIHPPRWLPDTTKDGRRLDFEAEITYLDIFKTRGMFLMIWKGIPC